MHGGVALRAAPSKELSLASLTLVSTILILLHLRVDRHRVNWDDNTFTPSGSYRRERVNA